MQELNQEMDAFIYRSSHDLRTPITNISGLLEIYETSDDEEKTEIILKSKLNIERLIKILDDLSNYSKNHRLEVSYQLIDINEIVQSAREKLVHLPHLSKTQITVTEIGTSDFISDPERLKVILINIIENSICFYNQEKDHILVEVLLEKQGMKTIMRIKDNGEGIKNEMLPKIFNMFFRGSIKSIGSGLGLYIVQRIVNKLKGDIKVHSQRGVGTEFTIEFPNMQDATIISEMPDKELNALHLT